MNRCIVAHCPVQNQPAGCGFLAAGTPCRHPRWREAWADARAAQMAPGNGQGSEHENSPIVGEGWDEINYFAVGGRWPATRSGE